jgi:hypothetical protein
MTMSGVIMLMGLRIAFKLSGSSVLPAGQTQDVSSFSAFYSLQNLSNLPAYPAEKVESGNKRGGSGVSIQS